VLPGSGVIEGARGISRRCIIKRNVASTTMPIAMFAPTSDKVWGTAVDGEVSDGLRS
jgi:hypothetical protein